MQSVHPTTSTAPKQIIDRKNLTALSGALLMRLPSDKTDKLCHALIKLIKSGLRHIQLIGVVSVITCYCCVDQFI